MAIVNDNFIYINGVPVSGQVHTSSIGGPQNPVARPLS